MSKRTLVTWTALIAGYAHFGHGRDAIQIFHEMEVEGIDPDDLCFLKVISACTHIGLLEKALNYLLSMSSDHCLEPSQEHYVCVADGFGRIGNLKRAEEVIYGMPYKPNAEALGALLGACRIHPQNSPTIGKRAANQVLRDNNPKDVHRLLHIFT
ncbi:hypothetical protein SELMODRAFT_132819 [Selaginella moellendorffii]|uniref:Pentacotripeptide-repeat region of PRORP domain-containing protein n=2 Tax=Selaginella moellendorffii TaxID=88036 RepID=D8T621_SELML|nr:hypothetical protein SELMODRAFT_132819 [Selaginella moellendorffii]